MFYYEKKCVREYVRGFVCCDSYVDAQIAKLLNDITEIQCRYGKLYLAATQDCSDGALVGMKPGDNKKTELCSLKTAILRYGKTDGMIVHSNYNRERPHFGNVCDKPPLQKLRVYYANIQAA